MIGYVWTEKYEGTTWLGVVVPDENMIIWSSWLKRTDATLRKRHTDGYWLFHPVLREDVEHRFIAAGWVLDPHKPKKIGGVSNSHGRPDDRQGPTIVPRRAFTAAYAALFVIPSAPKCVVDAAYKALFKEVHPDLAQDTDEKKVRESQSKDLNSAKSTIYGHRGW